MKRKAIQWRPNYGYDFRRWLRRPLTQAEDIIVRRLERQRCATGQVRALIHDPDDSFTGLLVQYYRWICTRIIPRVVPLFVDNTEPRAQRNAKTLPDYIATTGRAIDNVLHFEYLDKALILHYDRYCDLTPGLVGPLPHPSLATLRRASVGRRIINALALPFARKKSSVIIVHGDLSSRAYARFFIREIVTGLIPGFQILAVDPAPRASGDTHDSPDTSLRPPPRHTSADNFKHPPLRRISVVSFKWPPPRHITTVKVPWQPSKTIAHRSRVNPRQNRHDKTLTLAAAVPAA